ncbi:MAG: hypothetical protein HQL44_04500 [Alphaproteobacteria bacterium]|nr:hypothetical protein [Alphaproteobacteria bacterium]
MDFSPAILGHFLTARLLRSFRDRHSLEVWQEQKMRAFRQKVLARLPLYRNLANAPLDAFPIADKKFVQDNFQNLNVLGLSFDEALRQAKQGVSPRGYMIGMSSGTSGNRGVFLVNECERKLWAGIMLAKALPPGGLLKRHRAALMLAANSKLYKATQKSGRLAFRFFDLSQGLACHREALEAYQPTLLIAPAHVLGLMACQKWSIHPERAFSAAEVLDKSEEEAIGNTWGRPVHQIYQCTEGFLGITCRLGTMHLNEDYVLIEKQWIDKERRAFTPLITDFTRRSQAMVRYRMNDILIASPTPCPCGSPLQAIARIEGRRDDILAFPTQGGGMALLFPDDVRATLLDAAPAASDFRVQQHSRKLLTFALEGQVPDEQARNAANKLSEAIRRIGAEPGQIQAVPFIPIENHAVKLRRIVREFSFREEAQ